MNDILFFVSLIAGWITLNILVLPWFGIQTCMSGACKVPPVAPPRHTAEKPVTDHQTDRR